MTNFLRGFAERSADDPNVMGSPIRFVASTENKGRDGLIIEARGWQLDEYAANPSVLWSHDYRGERPPIGRAERVWVDGNRLLADIVFDQDDPFAVAVEKKYRNNMLHSVSVGWNSDEMDGKRVTKATLLDISAVNIPGDPGALIQRQKRAYADLGRELLALSEDDGDPQPPASPAPESVRSSWDETSAAMVELFRAYDPRSDEQRREDYDRLSRDYGRHKKTPPEFATNAELEAFDADTLRGRFLEGETDLHPDRFTSLAQRKGAVISRKNFEDLTQAAALISGVLERSTKAKPEADATETDDERAATDALARWLNTKG